MVERRHTDTEERRTDRAACGHARDERTVAMGSRVRHGGEENQEFSVARTEENPNVREENRETGSVPRWTEKAGKLRDSSEGKAATQRTSPKKKRISPEIAYGEGIPHVETGKYAARYSWILRDMRECVTV